MPSGWPRSELNNTFYRMPKRSVVEKLGDAGCPTASVRGQGFAADHVDAKLKDCGELLDLPVRRRRWAR